MDRGGLPDPTAGGEIPGHSRAEGDTGHGKGGELQGEYRSGVADGKTGQRFSQKIEDQQCRNAEKCRVSEAATHGSLNPAGLVAAQFLRHQSRRGKADAGDGKGGAEIGDRERQLIEPDPGRSDPGGQPDLKGHADSAHQQGRECEKRGVIDKTAVLHGCFRFLFKRDGTILCRRRRAFFLEIGRQLM